MPDFGKPRKVSNEWYDLYEDWGLIEASFTAQYGIRLRSENDMSWDEFSTLLAGIMPETPLGQIVSIRSEDDKEMLKNFTPAQHKIRNDWKRRMNRIMASDKQSATQQIKAFQEMMRRAFS